MSITDKMDKYLTTDINEAISKSESKNMVKVLGASIIGLKSTINYIEDVNYADAHDELKDAFFELKDILTLLQKKG